MNVTGCIPLAGQGLVARRGNLTALTDGTDPGPDPLLAALSAVADAGGDGAALALAGTRAALERGGRPAWACAGVTFGGEVAVLVHGAAVALVSADGGPEAEVSASGSMIPVVRAFTGAVVTVRLAIGAPAASDPRLWLDGGVVYGGGLLLTVTQEASQAHLPGASQPSAASTAPVELEQVAEDTVSRRAEAPTDAVPVAAVPVDAAYQAGYEPTMLAGPAARDVPPPPGPAWPEPVQPEPVQPGPVQPAEAFEAGYEPTMLAGSAQRQGDPPAGGPAAHPEPSFTAAAQFPEGAQFPEAAQFPEGAQFPGDAHPAAAPALAGAPANGAGPDTESWFRADAQPSGPTARMTQSDFTGPPGMTEPPIADLSTMELVQLGAAEPVLVDGTMCARMHFNAPEAMFCRECGMSMHEVTPNVRRQPRPPLGVLLVDDGRGFTLDRDYVIGREPVLDGDVAAGRATPLRISDPKGTVSRLHLRVSLVGWQVEVRDLGSANGSVLYRQGGPRTLAPLDAAVLDPGARVGVGRRTVQFLPYGAAPLGAIPYGVTS
jgi:hypothetical protein